MRILIDVFSKRRFISISSLREALVHEIFSLLYNDESDLLKKLTVYKLRIIRQFAGGFKNRRAYYGAFYIRLPQRSHFFECGAIYSVFYAFGTCCHYCRWKCGRETEDSTNFRHLLAVDDKAISGVCFL